MNYVLTLLRECHEATVTHLGALNHPSPTQTTLNDVVLGLAITEDKLRTAIEVIGKDE